MKAISLLFIYSLNTASLNYTDIMTDEWNYANNMVQSVLGITGFLAIFTTFYNNWYFYQKIQKDMIKEFKQRIDAMNGYQTDINDINDIDQYDKAKLIMTDKEIIEAIKHIIDMKK